MLTVTAARECLLRQRAELERQADQNGFDVALAIEEFAGAVAKYGDGSPEALAAEAKADALFDAGEVLVERLDAISGEIAVFGQKAA